MAATATGDWADCLGCHWARKPVIYLYPERSAEVAVRLEVRGRLSGASPAYDRAISGWRVTAAPDGSLLAEDGSVYPYLYWEADLAFPIDEREGFVLASAEVDAFLREKLTLLGLSEAERRDFTEYWSPRMRRHPYCRVRFEGAEYERAARLAVTPAPDTTIRVFMTFEGMRAPVSVRPQRLTPAPRREGFVVVEWGGMELGGRR